jgi:hypothetical protein
MAIRTPQIVIPVSPQAKPRTHHRHARPYKLGLRPSPPGLVPHGEAVFQHKEHEDHEDHKARLGPFVTFVLWVVFVSKG